MAQNREEILADFQACTGIEDVAEAIYHLDETDWDLLRAVNRVVPADTQSFNNSTTQDVVMIDDDVRVTKPPVQQIASDIISVANHIPLPKPILENHVTECHSQPSTSTVKNNVTPKMLRFNVQYCERTITIEIPDTGTVADIKLRLSKDLKIAPCRQLLSNWARHTQFENTPLFQLMLPTENTLQLHIKPMDGGFSAEDSEISDRLTGVYTLKITVENTNKIYNLKFQGTKTILEVKTDVYTLTDIHVRNQIWCGWPPNIDDQTMLALSGIGYPEHELSLRHNTIANNIHEKKPNTTVEIHDSDDDEYEDATETFTVDDEMFVDNLTSKRIEPLSKLSSFFLFNFIGVRSNT